MPIYEISGPGGKTYSIEGPEGATREQVIAAIKSRLAEQEPDRTVLGQVGETFKGVGRGFAGAFLSAGEGLAELADAATNVIGLEDAIDSGDENELVKASRAGRDWINNSFLGADPSYQDAWWTKFGEGVGSMASFLTPTAALRGLGAAGKATKLGMGRNELAAAATLAGGAGAGDQAQRIAAARAQGIEVDETDEDTAIALGGLVGLSEIAPIAQILKRVPKNITPANKSRILDLLQRSLVGGFQEGLQEAGAGLAQDFIEQGIYNENLPIGESLWDEFTVGGAVGAFTDFVINAAAGRRNFITTEAQKEYEAKLREREAASIQKIEQELLKTAESRAARQADPNAFAAAADQAQANAANIAPPQVDAPPVAAGEAYARVIANELGDFFPTNTKFEVKEIEPTVTSRGTLANGETIVEQKPNFVVVDSNGKQYGQAVDSREKAAGLAYGLNTEVIDGQVRGQVISILENSGQAYSPETAATLMRYGYQILNPESNMITSAALNEAAGTTAVQGYIENYSPDTILQGEEVKEEGKTVGYKLEGPNGMTVVPGLTLSQQINQKRKEQGLPETQVFTIEEAREALGDKFENLTNINVLAVPDGMTYTATLINGKPSVVSNANEVFTSRFANQEDSDAAGKNEDGSAKVKVGQKIDLQSLEDAQAFADRKNREAARGQGLSVKEVNALMKGEKNFSQEITRLLKSKNIGSEIDSPEVKKLFGSIIGKESLSNMSSGEQRLLYARLRNLPTFESTTKLPVFEAKPYTRDNFLRASKFIQDANAVEQPFTDEQIAEAAGLMPNDERKDIKVQALKKDLEAQGIKAKPAQRPAVIRETIGGISVDIPLALPAPTGTTDTYNFLREEIRKKMKGFGLDDIATRIDQTLLNFYDPVRYMQEMGSETEGYYNPFLREITLAVDRIDPQKTLTPEQRLNALVDVLNHEIVHPARELDLWTDKEWDTLSNAAARLKRKDDKGNATNQTYLEWARQNYADQSPLIQEEEAVADLSRQAQKFGAKAVAGRPKVLADKLFNFFERLDNSFRGAGFQSYTDILNRLQSGEIGARTRGEIRTLRATEAEQAAQGDLPARFRDYQPIIANPVLRNQEREERKVEVQQKGQEKGVTDFNPAALEGAAIRESRSSIEKVPANIEVEGKLKPTRDSEGRVIYSGYEGPDIYNIQTVPTEQGLRNFWRWFGDSKAVSRDGRPLVYYHGTAADITAFRPKQAGSVFVTKSPSFANEFAGMSEDYMVGNFTDFMSDQQVLDVLNETLESPSAFAPKTWDKVAKLRDSVANSVAAGRPITAKTIEGLTDVATEGRSSRFAMAIQTRLPSAANLVPVYVKAENPFDYQNEDHVKRVLKRADELSPTPLGAFEAEGVSNGDWGVIETPTILQAIRDLGFDSMYVEEAGQKNLAVFNPNQVKSAIGNNGEFGVTPSIRESRREEPKVIVSGPPIPESIDDVSSLESASRFATSKFFSGNRLFKQELQDRVLTEAKAKKVDITNLDDPEVIKYLVRVGVKDAMRAMETNKNAIGWYDRKVRAALNILSKIHPELATDENSKFAFVYALAVTSNGMKVNRNFELAEQAYNHFKRTGEMPTNIGEGQAADAIDNSMALFNRLKKSMTMEAMRKTMLTDFKVGILNRMGFDVSGELADTDVRGAAIIGPKIGNGFFSNLYGIFDALTMDRWLMRTWGRWTGTLITQKPELLASQGINLENAIERLRKNKEGFENLQQIIGLRIPPVPKDEIERNGWLALVSNAINRASVDPENRAQINSLPNGERIRKDGNNYSKTLDGQNEAPANGTQRNQIRGVFNQILSELRKQNPELTMSDLQALLWYPEKRLYDTSKSKDDAQLESYEDEDAPDYANAAAVLARKNGVPDKEIKDAIAQAETDSARVRAETAGRGSIEQQAIATAGQRPQGLSAAKRKRFIAQSILARIRSNRSSNGTASEPYQRASGKNGKSVRLLGLRTPVLGKYLPARVFGNDLKAMDQNPVKFSELDSRNGGNALFHKAITEFKNSNPDAASVYVYPESDYSDMRLFLSASGKTGVAIKPDGDIVSVFSNERAGRSAMEIAIQMGGRKLDAFDTVLPNFYKAHGFSEVARLNWDDSQAPADWDKKKFSDFNNGEPDVVFMVYDPNGFITQDTAPVFTDYGEALNAQTEAVKNISPPISDGQMQESPEEIQAEESEVRPRSQSQLDEAVVKAEEDIAKTPTGSIPLYDLNASPDALYVAQNPEAGYELTPEERVRFSRTNQPEYPKDVQKIIDRLAVEPPDETVGETVVNGLALPPFRNMIDRFRQDFIDKNSRLEYLNQRDPSLMHNMADVSSIAAVEMADRSRAITASAVKHGVPVYRNGMVKIEDFVHNGKRYNGLMGVMAPLYSTPYGNLEVLAQAYAIARRGRRLTSEDKLAPGEAGDLERLEQQIDQYKNPETGESIIREWYDAWQAYNAYTIRFLRDTGMIDEAGAKLWLEQSDYIPFYREKKTGQLAFPKIFGGLTSTTNLKSVGRSTEAINMPLLDSVLTNLDAAIAMGMKNVAQQRVIRDMIQIGLGRMVRVGEKTEGLPTVTFKVDGKKVTAIVDDPLIYESMQTLPELGAGGVLESIFRVPANILREMITREPGYMLANIMRDTASVTMTSGASLGSTVTAVKNFADGFEQLQRTGAIGGYDFSRDPEDMVKFLADEAKKMGHEIPVEYNNPVDKVARSKYFKPLTWIWDAAGRLSDRAEALNRIRVYEDTLARTGNEAEAVYQALSVLNYGRRGRSPLIRVLTAVVPFLNARIQGLDKLYQAGTGQVGAFKDRRRNIVRFTTRAGLMVGLTMLYYSMVSDDEEYKRANQEVIDNYYIFPTGMGFAIRIPIPFEVGILFKTIPERIMRLADETDTFREARQSAGRAVFSTLAFNPVPQAVLPIAEVIANYDTFTGRSIIPPYMDERMAAEYQARFGTNELARLLGEATGFSPIKIDHLLNGYFGTLGTYTLDAVDHALRGADRMYPERKAYEYPFIRRFFADQNQPGLQSQFYDLYREVGKVNSTINRLREDGRVDELNAYIMENQNIIAVKRNVDHLNKVMRNYRDQKEAILKSTLEPEVKRQLIDQLDSSINKTLEVIPILRRAAFAE